MKKNYVLDTNVLLHDPTAIFKFEDNDVAIPIFVIEEIDQFKKEVSELGRNARQAARSLDEFRENGGHLSVGVDLPGGGILRVLLPRGRRVPARLDHQAQDNAILAVAIELRDADTTRPTVFVTMDTNLRIRADALGLKAENYDSDRVNVSDLYTGYAEIDGEPSEVDRLGQKGGHVGLVENGLHPNQCVLLRDKTNPNHTALGRVDPQRKVVVPLRVPREGIWGVRPRNKEQAYALDLLLDDSVKIVTLVGKAGTGKTLLALAAGLRKTVDDGTYSKLLVSRPIFPLGRDLGYLPGDVEDKLNPWMQPVFDNLDLIRSLGGRDRSGRAGSERKSSLYESGVIEIEPLTYIRGRSLTNRFLIVDEAQNLTPHEVKTIITRCGGDTKIVLAGDPQQIDNPYVDAASNGLTCAADRFRGEVLAGHIALDKGERGDLAELAANKL